MLPQLFPTPKGRRSCRHRHPSPPQRRLAYIRQILTANESTQSVEWPSDRKEWLQPVLPSGAKPEQYERRRRLCHLVSVVFLLWLALYRNSREPEYSLSPRDKALLDLYTTYPRGDTLNATPRCT